MKWSLKACSRLVDNSEVRHIAQPFPDDALDQVVVNGRVFGIGFSDTDTVENKVLSLVLLIARGQVVKTFTDQSIAVFTNDFVFTIIGRIIDTAGEKRNFSVVVSG